MNNHQLQNLTICGSPYLKIIYIMIKVKWKWSWSGIIGYRDCIFFVMLIDIVILISPWRNLRILYYEKQSRCDYMRSCDLMWSCDHRFPIRDIQVHVCVLHYESCGNSSSKHCWNCQPAQTNQESSSTYTMTTVTLSKHDLIIRANLTVTEQISSMSVLQIQRLCQLHINSSTGKEG